MKLTAQVKLISSDEQAQALKHTLETANAACDYISDIAWAHGQFRQFDLQKLCYYELKARFNLTAQMAIQTIKKVADAYKLDRNTQRTFKTLGAISYDSRILSWNLSKSIVSIWTTAGRLKMPFACGERQRKLLETQQGESDLVYRDGTFYLFTTCNVEDVEPTDVSGFLGVDMGVVNICADSDGEVHSAKAVNNVRHRHRRLRSKLQSIGTKSAKRRLKKLAGKEARFARHTNHEISKHLVVKAERTGRGIAVEDLTGINDRTRVRKPQRATRLSWAFHQLRAFITYKAQLRGVKFCAVDPRNTSRTCPSCGDIHKHNRPKQSVFKCIQCGLAGLADIIAACNIASRGALSLPHAATTG